ncbi:hypothetical protein MLD38_009871 [Melastoma candidum]|uniref:Uncharacterized protein n=1 Tax=Melastoma candidum TaxID=119954 RepID=A0ACB9RYY0_9MYRT|nr:hypothetical protein MLD38_009871 [Melastoma candidum]
MQKSGSVPRGNSNSLRVSVPTQALRRMGFCSPGGGQHASPIVFPEKRNGKAKGLSRQLVVNPTSGISGGDGVDLFKAKSVGEHRIDIIEGVGGGDEKSDLLGFIVYNGKLALDKRRNVDGAYGKNRKQNQGEGTALEGGVDAKLTSKALVWGNNVLPLDEIVSVSYHSGLRHFTVHAYPQNTKSCDFLRFRKSPKRSRKDFRFLTSSKDEAIQWVGAFADQQCYVNCLPHPLVSSKKQASSELRPIDPPPELLFRCKNPPRMLVILNPRSGRGRSTKVFHGMVEPIFKLAGFQLEVVNTTHAGHAKTLASSVDFSTCPDGIICVGGDGIVNEVLNGLLTRDNQKEGISIPMGIIPAGSDNSLVRTVLGVRDPISAALAIVKGGLTATDVFAVSGFRQGAIHFGMTVSYIWLLLELSEKYQKRFGPLRYFVAGFLKFLCMPKYKLRRCLVVIQIRPQAALMPAPSRQNNVRAIDPKSKRLSSGRRQLSDPGPIWDAEPKWDAEPHWEVENPIELPGPSDDLEADTKKETNPEVGGEVGGHQGAVSWRIVISFVRLQIGRHLELPYVDYIKVKSVKIKAGGKHTHNSCGIDGELFPLNGQVISSLLPSSAD